MIFNEDYHINMLMSNKDVYIRFDKFRTGEINKLLIPGLSGSGKSTLARELSKKYNCPCIELDKFRGQVYYTDEEIKRDHPYIYKYFQTEFTKGDRHNIAKMEPEERREEFYKFIYWLLKQPERMIIEGALERILYLDDDMRKTYPMVFKGTSMLKSMARMSWREFKREHPGRDSIDNLLWWMKWCSMYKKMTDQHNKVREKIMGDVNMDDYEEREENDLPLIMEAMGYKPHPIVFSDDDVYINYDKWKSGECTSLLVTGLSGGGKSSLSKKLAEKFNAYYVEIDVISFKIGILKPQRANWEYIQKNDKYLYKFLKENNLPPTIMQQFKNYQDPKKSTIIDKYVYWLCFERDDLDTNRVVIEGGDVAISLTNIKELSNLPIIIKGTSLAKSLFRRINRTLNSDNHGDDIWYILKLIFNGTYYSQYSKMYPEVDNARKAVMNQEYDEIHESFVPELIMYHGSSHKFDKVKPISFSAGNKLRDPSWAVFMLRQYDLALSYVVGNYVKEKCKENGIKYSFCAWIEKDGFMHYKPIVLADKKNFQKVKDLVRGDTVYVYTLKVPIDDKLNMIGTTNTLPEYVYSGVPKTIKRDDIVITDELLDSLVTDQIDEKEFQKIKKSKPHKINRIGSWADLFIDMDKRKEMRDKVLPKIDSGEIKPGDDLSWLKESSNIKHTFTHKELCDIYQNQMITENSAIYIPHESGNITQHIPGAYFNEEFGVWMRKPNQEELGKLRLIESEYDPKTGKIIYNTESDDKFLEVFEADEKEWLKKVYYKSFPNIRSGVPQPVINIKGHKFRPRCEVIIIDGDKALIDPLSNRGEMGYSCPGGGIDPNESIADGAKRECEEEARVIPKDIMYTGLAWTLEFKTKSIAYFGSISFICVATKKKDYKGYVKVADRDKFVDNATWIPISKLSKPHQMAIDIYNKRFLKEEFNGYEFHPLIETKPVWDPKLWRDPGPNIRDFDIKKELKTFMYPQAIKEKYKGPNLYINLPGLSKDKRFRVRCEMIILDSEGRMLVDRKRTFKRMNLSYDNTGGGIDPGEEIVDAAAREAQEEARITVKDPMDSMLWYAYEVPEDSKKNYGFWGVASFICVGKKKSMYKGYIKVDDRDGFLTRSEWIKPEDIKDLLPAHKQAIEMYKNYYLQESLGINMEFLNNEYV